MSFIEEKMDYYMDNFIEHCDNCHKEVSDKKVITVENAIIEEISFAGKIGKVTIAYGEMDFNQTIVVNVVALIVNENTILHDRFGRDIKFRSLRKGMVIYAEFSMAMTRSVPPQAQAFKLIVLNDIDNANVTVGRVFDVDYKHDILSTGNANNIYSQMKFIITNTTSIFDRRGNRINLKNIRPGDTVRVEHASYQTFSIPPQTTAYSIQVL